MSKKGLKPEHHSEINKPNVPKSRLNQLRAEYKNNHTAQQQIDVYDGNTEYHGKFREYREAVQSGNTAQEGILTRWFKKFYPDIT